MSIQGPDIRLDFQADEYFALQELARKLHTDPGSVLRIGLKLALEADRRGLIRVSPDAGAIARVLAKEPS